jgi:hypothetical protein
MRAGRVIYYVDNDAVVILEVFAKTTTKTPQQVIDVCKARLKSYQSCKARSNTMKVEKLKQPRTTGWQAGSANDFLRLSNEEAVLVEIKITLTDAVRQALAKHKLSQYALALRIQPS